MLQKILIGTTSNMYSHNPNWSCCNKTMLVLNKAQVSNRIIFIHINIVSSTRADKLPTAEISTLYVTERGL